MIFSSTVFLFLFLPITIIVHIILPRSIKNYWLLIVSVIFFAWGQPKYLWIIAVSILINYLVALAIDRIRHRGLSIFLLISGLLGNLLLLFYYKYFNFVVENVSSILKRDMTLTEVVLPIGISFFTFQGMSYVIDVYKGVVPVQKNLFKLALYITLFPQLIAGPIVRYKDIKWDIDNREISLNDYEEGTKRFIIGLFKKVVTANTLAAVSDGVWRDYIYSSSLVLWIGSFAYTLQIYFDFSGYSDMAIGLGRILGFRFCENFNLPYISKSINEFWRRWHISLSSWFRDYVYIPLGGNRNHVYLNLGIVFLLTGIWHGASWTFVLWGIINGLFVIFERIVKDKYVTSSNGIVIRIVSRIYTLFVINLSWVLFRAPSLKDAVSYAKRMFAINNADILLYKPLWYLDRWTVMVFLIAIIGAGGGINYIRNKYYSNNNSILMYIIKDLSYLLILYMSILRIVSGTYNPFIYFQF